MGCVSNPGKVRRLFSISVLFIFFVFSVNAVAMDAPRKEAQSTIQESLEALWAGQAFSPQLQQKQQALKNMLDSGVLTKNDLEDMIAKNTLSIMNRKKTSRYVLREFPERVEALLAAHLKWEEFRQAVWRVGASVIGDDQQVVISVGTLAPSGTPWINVPEKFIPVLEALSNKKYTIRIYSGGVMGEDTDILRKMDVGQLDGCGCTALGILTASPEATVFLLPGLFNNYDEIDYIFERFRKRIDEAFEKQGYLLASLIDTGNFHFFSKNRISSLADIRRSKVLSWFGVIENTIYDELGISAMPVSVTEIVSALSTGMADTNLAPAAWMLGMQAYQYARYFVKEPLLYSPAAIFVSTRTRERLQRQFGMSDIFSHNIQELLIFELSSLESEWRIQTRRYEERCLDAFTNRVGMKAVTLPPADRKAIEEAGRNVWTRLAGKTYSRGFLDDILSALEEYRSDKP